MKLNKTVKAQIPSGAPKKAPAAPTKSVAKTKTAKGFTVRTDANLVKAQLWAARGTDILEGAGIKAGQILQMKWGNQPALADVPGRAGKVVAFKPNGTTRNLGNTYRIMRSGGDADYGTVLIPAKQAGLFKGGKIKLPSGDFLGWVKESPREPNKCNRGVKVS